MAESREAERDQLLLAAMLRSPVRTVDSALRTGVSLVQATIDALRAVPRLAAAMERLAPALRATQSSLDRIDRIGTFVAQELPETQHQLEELRRQLAATLPRVSRGSRRTG
jgi:hypothetical protein